MKKNKIFELLTFLIVEIGILAIFFASILFTYKKISFEVISYTLYGFGSSSLIVYIFHIIKEKKVSKFEIWSYVLFLFLLISTITAIDKETAMFGHTGRLEGFFAIASYYAIMLCSIKISKKKYKNIILWSIIVVGFFNGIYGLMQIKWLPSPFKVYQKWKFARGFFHNSLFYASYLCLCYGMMFGMFFYSNLSIIKFLIYLLLTFFGIISGSMTFLVSVIAVHIIGFINKITQKKNCSKKHVLLKSVISILVLVISSILFVNGNHYYRNDIEELRIQTKETLSGYMEDNFGSGRIYIWKNTIDKIGKYIITGVGPDSFVYAFEEKLIDPKSHLPLDKAHNEYLQMMLCEGLFAGVFYIFFISYLWFRMYFKKKDKTSAALFYGFTCYIIQAFFSISMTRVAPMFWCITGLLINEVEKKQYEEDC